MVSFLKKNLYPLFLVFISIILFFTNYKAGAYLIGWDNLFPEFNFKLNFIRDFFAVWQQYRSLGALDNFAQASNLIHDSYRLLLSFFLPKSLIRWVFIFLMHLTGGLGIYFLVKKILKKNYAAFIGALFYQFNLGTVQQFFLPFEAFVIHFAFLPWLFLTALNFFENKNKKSFILLFIISIIALPQVFIPTLFAVYFSGIFLFFLTKTALDRFKRTDIKKFFLLLGVILITNSFWILPAGYSLLTYSKIVANAKNYQMASNDIFYRNKKYGDFKSMALIKGVVLGFQATDYKTNSGQYMMWPWLNHINSLYFLIPAWIFFILALIGFYKSLFDKKLLPFVAVFVFAFFMMGTDIPVINWLVDFLRQSSSLFAIIFRFTFTKFSILYVFSYSVLLATGLNFVLEKTKKSLFVFFCFLLLIIYAFPSFQGHFFYENLAVKVPKDYFQLFDFFRNQNQNERVAVLPIPWYWAWLQPKWGTINSGFTWYGIAQSTTDLAFTPWGKQNENFYWEFDQAIFSKNPQLLEKVLDKYDVNWIYLDKNILNEPGRKVTYEIYEELLNNTNTINLVNQTGRINIYRRELKKSLESFIGIKTDLLSIGPQFQYDNYDQAYLDYGDYFSGKENEIYYPFRSLFSGKNPQDVEYKVEENDRFLYFKSRLPDGVKNWPLLAQETFQEEFSITDQGLKTRKYIPKISIENGFLTVKIDKNQTQIYTNKTDGEFLNQTNDACEKGKTGVAQLEKTGDYNFKLTSIDSNNCIKINLPNLSQRFGYLINIETVSNEKRGLLINLTNNTTDKQDLETYTDSDGNYHNYYLVSSPRGFYDLGYSIYFNNISEGREKIVNNLGGINIYQIPYFFLKDIRMVKNNQIKISGETEIFPEIVQKNFAFYQVKMNITGSNSILYLSQSYNPGWIAFSDGKLLDHVIVNNWANGWKLNDQTNEVTIIFWPQYLEFIGFVLLAAAGLRILLIKEKHE